MGKRFIRRSEEQWRELVVGQEASGKSQEAYCQARGISKTTFWKWRRRLKRRGPAFVELTPEVGRRGSARVEVEIGGVMLRIWS